MTLADTNIAVGDSVQPLPISPLQINGAILSNARPTMMQVDSKVGQHDQLQISVIMPILDSSTLVDKPVFLRYGGNPDYGYFYGYTNHVSKPQTPGVSSQIDITALGFSSVMKQSPSRMFRTQSTGQILNTLLGGYRIGLAQQDHSFVHQRLAQVGMTDWEFAVKVAGMAGFYLYPSNGVLVMSQPIRALNYGAPSRVFTKSSQILDDQPLMDFVPDERSDETTVDFEPEMAYFTASGIQTSVPDAPPEHRVKVSDYIYSQEYAQFITEGMKVMTGMYQTATARIRGNAAVRPGSTVVINTGATAAAIDSFDGLWYVDYTSTYIDNKVFQTALKLCRDKYRSPSNAYYQQFYDNDARRFPTMKLGFDGLWQSSWSTT